MDLHSLLPLFTGGAGCIVTLVVGWALVLHEDLVTGRQHRRDLRRDAATIARLEAVVAKLETANDQLRDTAQTAQSQMDRLLDGSALSNTLAQALVSAVQQPRPAQTERPAGGD